VNTQRYETLIEIACNMRPLVVLLAVLCAHIVDGLEIGSGDAAAYSFVTASPLPVLPSPPLAVSPAHVASLPSRAASPSLALSAASEPIQVTVFSPAPGDVAGRNGSGFVVDIALDVASSQDNNLLSNYVPYFNDPSSKTFKPGSASFAPGLVVTLSTTEHLGTAFRGPGTNLAGLFQINGIAEVNFGDMAEAWNTWIAQKPLFGADLESMLTVFVVNGTAPDIVADDLSGYDIISNIVVVPFTIAGDDDVADVFGPAEVTVLSPGEGDVSGVNGTGFVIDVLLQYGTSLSSVSKQAKLNTVAGPTIDILPEPFFNDPSSPSFHPGSLVSSPGLVVTLSTTKNVSGTPFQGPSTNLAGLFQVTGISSNSTVLNVQNVWLPGKALFGVNVESELTVFVVEGTAPLYIPPYPAGIISEVVKVTFTIAG